MAIVGGVSGGWARRAVLALAPAGATVILLPMALSQVEPVGADQPANFVLLSQVLTGSAQLDAGLAASYWAALVSVLPGDLADLRQLCELVRLAPDAEALMVAAKARGLDAAAARLTAAWFTGTVGSGLNARTVAYADALMYATVRDGLSPPTYAHGGPAWWAGEPPPAGVAAPLPQPARPVASVVGARPGSVR